MKINIRCLNLVLIFCITMGAILLYPCKTRAADLTVGAGCAYASISAAMDAANPGDRLLIEGGVTFTENLTIDKNLTLQGGHDGCGSGSSENTTIDGEGTGRVVDISLGLTVTLANLNITNGSSGTDGGGIRFAPGAGTGTLTLSSVNIYGNTAQWGGGLWVGADADLNGENIQIYNNTATTYGGGVRLYGGRAEFTNSNIHDNTAPSGGGVYAAIESGFAPALNLSSTEIYGNEALTTDGFGGGIYMSEGSVLVADGSDIFMNSAIEGGGAYLSSSTLTLDGTTSEIKFNTATGNGGGIYATGSTVNLDDGAELRSNSAGSDGTGNGGGACLDGSSLYSDKALIRYNTAASYGGGVYAINGSYFDMDLGGYTCLGSRCSQLSYNTATSSYGGGVYAKDSTLDLHQIFVEGNTASVGGAIYAYQSQVYLYNALIAGNDSTAGTGDGIRLYNGATLDGAHNTFAYNDAGGASTGQAIAMHSATLTLSNSIVWGHATSVTGDTGSTQTITYSDIQGGYAGTGNRDVDPLFVAPASGDFHLQEASPVIDRCATGQGLDFDNEPRPLADIRPDTPYDMGADEFSTPRVGINGSGSLYGTLTQAVAAAADGDTIQLSAGTYTEAVNIEGKNITISGGYDSTATTPGVGTTILDGQYQTSVIDISSSSVVTLCDLQITGGSGSGGGGLKAVDNSQVTLDNVLITGNTSSYGGGLYVGTNAEVTLTNSTQIDNNTATVAGGGARVWGILTSQDTTSDITNNSAPHGGGVSVKGGELHLINADMSGNQATAADGKGGAILLEDGAIATMTGANAWIYNGNQAYDGAGIYADGSEIFLGTATIGGNIASNGGGGIYLTNDSSLSASDATIGKGTYPYGNEAAYGAGICVAGSTVDFGGTIFNNLATTQGAGIYAEASTINLTNATVGGTDTNQANQLGPDGHMGAGLYFKDATQATLNNTMVSGNSFQTTGYTYGGGAYVANGSVLTLNSSTIENHLVPSETTGRGAGIYIDYSTVTMDNSAIVSNTAGQSGGGIRLYGTSTLTVLNGSTIADNQSLNGEGGAIAAIGSPTINISNAILMGNTASTDGGAIYLDAGTLNMAYTHLYGNSAERGGAIYQTGTAASEVSNSLIYSNTSTTGFGAGIRTFGGTFDMTHVTLANNINGAGYSQSNTTGNASNCIAWGNASGGFWVTSGTIDGTCNIDQSGNVGSAINPRFVDAASGDFHLLGDSPAIDACSTGLSPDLDNIPRPFGDDYDMGAYEFYVEYAVEAVTNPEGVGTVSGTGTFIQGSTVTVTASAEPGYVFSHYTLDNMVAACSASYSFPATGDVTLQANFSQEQSQYDITCAASPVNYGSVTGAGSYSHEADATVSVFPDSGYAFVHWIETWDGFQGSCVVSTEEEYTFTAERDRNLTAIIRPKTLPGVMMLLLDEN